MQVVNALLYEVSQGRNPFPVVDVLCQCKPKERRSSSLRSWECKFVLQLVPASSQPLNLVNHHGLVIVVSENTV